MGVVIVDMREELKATLCSKEKHKHKTRREEVKIIMAELPEERRWRPVLVLWPADMTLECPGFHIREGSRESEI